LSVEGMLRSSFRALAVTNRLISESTQTPHNRLFSEARTVCEENDTAIVHKMFRVFC